MTRFQARFCFLSFLCLATGISANALYLQDGQEAKLARARGAVTTAAVPRKKPVRKVRGAGQGLSQKTTPGADEFPRDLVRAIQRELASRGYAPGGADGVCGIMTRAAIMAFEYDNKIALSGEPSEALLKRMLLGPSVHLSDAERSRANSVPAIHTTKAVQSVLAELGYAPGAIDGLAGRETERAIRSFEKDRGLPETGRISGRLVKEIKRVTGQALTITG